MLSLVVFEATITMLLGYLIHNWISMLNTVFLGES